MNYRDRINEAAVQGNQAVMDVINASIGYRTAEECVVAVLQGGLSREVLETALQKFLDEHEEKVSRFSNHESWIHSLYHFTPKLWELRMTEWLQRFYRTALEGDRLREMLSGCTGTLIGQFVHYSLWSDDPCAYSLTPENLKLLRQEEYWREVMGYHDKRIEAGVFDSEVAFLRWKVLLPEAQKEHNYNVSHDMVNVAFLDEAAARLQELGEDMTEEIKGIKRKLLQEQLASLEIEVPVDKPSWNEGVAARRHQEALKITRQQLAEL